MKETSTYLFVYRSLLTDKNEFAAYLKQHCDFYGKGKFKGLLYDIGEYPGAIERADNNEYVYGSIYLLNDSDSILKVLDGYEGFGENCTQPNEFIRKSVTIDATGKLVNCWVYLYNLPVKEYKRIASGDYLLFKAIMGCKNNHHKKIP